MKNSLQDMLAANAAAALESVKGAIKTPKSSTKKANAKKEEVTPTLKPTAKKSKKEEVTEEVAAQQKASIVEEVISEREVKYIYPAEISDTISRKKWRQQTRNKLHQLEREVYRIQDSNSKEYKAAMKALNEFKAQVLKPGQAS